MAETPPANFNDADLLDRLCNLEPQALDRLPFGVIGFSLDPEATVVLYNATESRGAGLAPERVLALPLFTVVAQCMNNHLIAQRFEDALASGSALDTTLDWVFTFRMRPTPVTLRLLARPEHPVRYVAIHRATWGAQP